MKDARPGANGSHLSSRRDGRGVLRRVVESVENAAEWRATRPRARKRRAIFHAFPPAARPDQRLGVKKVCEGKLGSEPAPLKLASCS